jgi:hypothetical protein
MGAWCRPKGSGDRSLNKSAEEQSRGVRVEAAVGADGKVRKHGSRRRALQSPDRVCVQRLPCIASGGWWPPGLRRSCLPATAKPSRAIAWRWRAIGLSASRTPGGWVAFDNAFSSYQPEPPLGALGHRPAETQTCRDSPTKVTARSESTAGRIAFASHSNAMASRHWMI